MNKYIIRNCPCYNNERFLSGFLDDKDTICTYYSKNCQDNTDCVLKQIVELCKENLNSLETYVDVRSLECVTLQNILKLLDIQEVK